MQDSEWEKNFSIQLLKKKKKQQKKKQNKKTKTNKPKTKKTIPQVETEGKWVTDDARLII